MKQIRLLSLLLCLVLLLSACGRTDDPNVYNPAESTSKSPEPDKYGVWYMQDLLQMDYLFPIEGLYGREQDTFGQPYAPAIYADNYGSVVYGLDTDTGLLFSLNHSPAGNVPMRYDKSSGRFSLACMDPLCEHESERYGCIWSAYDCDVYRNGDALFFTFVPWNGFAEWMDMQYETPMPHCICRSDLNGNNVQKLYENHGGRIFQVLCCGEYLFFTEEQFDLETGNVTYAIMRLPLSGGRAEQLLADVNMFLPLDGGRKVLYTERKVLEDGGPSELGDCYLYDIETGEKTLFGNGSFPFASYRGWAYYNEGGCFYRMSETDVSIRERVLEATFYNDDQCRFVGDRMYYLRRSVFSESETYGKYYQWELYSAALDGSDQTLITKLEKDGIPDKVTGMWTDGNLLLVKYWPYWDFDNEYIENFVPSAVSSDYPMTYAMIDLSNGEQILFSADYRDMLALFAQSGRG